LRHQLYLPTLDLSFLRVQVEQNLKNAYLAMIESPKAAPVGEKAEALARQLRVLFQRLGKDRRIRCLVEDRSISPQASAKNCTFVAGYRAIGDDLLFNVNFHGPMIGTVVLADLNFSLACGQGFTWRGVPCHALRGD
jgi:hypothetical protein